MAGEPFETRCGYPVSFNGTVMVRLVPQPLLDPGEHLTMHLAKTRCDFSEGDTVKVTLEKVKRED